MISVLDEVAYESAESLLLYKEVFSWQSEDLKKKKFKEST